jgi:hypothetical protein
MVLLGKGKREGKVEEKGERISEGKEETERRGEGMTEKKEEGKGERWVREGSEGLSGVGGLGGLIDLCIEDRLQLYMEGGRRPPDSNLFPYALPQVRVRVRVRVSVLLLSSNL